MTAQPLPAYPAAEPEESVAPPPSRRRLRRAARGLVRILGGIAALVVLAAAGVVLGLRLRAGRSLAQLEGERAVRGLSAPVRVVRDEAGVPTLEGHSREDVAAALGFVHAQERFFQMDLLRRAASGELAELLGGALAERDLSTRAHRFRAVARQNVDALDAEERRALEAYRAGVNAGLDALVSKPFEYLVTRTEPKPWQLEDSLLCALAMFLRLHDAGRLESVQGVLRDTLHPAAFAFVSPRGTEWDAPILGRPFAAAPVPAEDVLSVRARAVAAAALEPEPIPGSNAWVVGGARAARGSPILANDMHLGLSVPNQWYRASLVWPESSTHHVTGVTLPGVPTMIVGTNTRVAWGFTNSQGDWADLIELETDSSDADAYRTAAGYRRFTHHTEIVRVKGEPDRTLDALWTEWGPVVDRDWNGKRRALCWTAHHAGAVNLHMLRLERAETLAEAFAAAHEAGLPPQNLLVADRHGRIGWTIIGRIPNRIGFDGRTPTSWASGLHRWDGWLPASSYPQVVDPAESVLWTANARMVEGAALDRLGDGGYALGARARQIRDALYTLPPATEKDLLAMQLDDRALFLDRWQRLLVRLLSAPAAGDPHHRALHAPVASWGGSASVSSVGYRIVRRFRTRLTDIVLGALTAECKRRDPRFEHGLLEQAEGPVWQILSERPPHLLPGGYRDWDALMFAVVDEIANEISEGGMQEFTWGAANRVRIRHPLSRAVPILGWWLDMPGEPLPGDRHMPRVQTPGFGASMRMVVSPGRESEGLFHMPGGASGNPRSAAYRAGHSAWAKGEATPLLPGPPRYVLKLVPKPDANRSRGL